MGKTAFIFPGQGAQYVGMAKDFYDTYPECKAIIDEACELMDFDLKQILFEENEALAKEVEEKIIAAMKGEEVKETASAPVSAPAAEEAPAAAPRRRKVNIDIAVDD